jgi:hypothetical protein
MADAEDLALLASMSEDERSAVGTGRHCSYITDVLAFFLG